MTFVAADYLQLEGVPELETRERVYYRLTQRTGSDDLSFIWKDVQTIDLVRCDGGSGLADDAASDPRPETVPEGAAATLPVSTCHEN
ncbi:hypothetical protein [uncultured Jannaschia sp.]|uniref:hypothetical protein n=1 Tax=uncultured Jannaschia sp. TaxID=293347 RepID=UPI002618ADFC|nr:hypothetical protein [uncultured Jannaschia sp.]